MKIHDCKVNLAKAPSQGQKWVCLAFFTLPQLTQLGSNGFVFFKKGLDTLAFSLYNIMAYGDFAGF
jgi:hypothetical protein